MSKVIVGMSGGVDSAVAAYLLKKEGYDVIGVMLRTWDSTVDNDSYEIVQNKCCEIDDARDTAGMLGIEFHAFNCINDFRCHVVEPFVNDYLCGRTPNPCVECNRYVKFEKLLYFANVLGADFIATGHYARKVMLPDGRFSVQRSDTNKKDQTYMLYKLSQEQLRRVLFPLEELDKDTVRNIAKEVGIPVAEKKDSQEICFIPDDDYAGYILKAANRLSGNDSMTSDDSSISSSKRCTVKEGDFVDRCGNVLGRHKGIIHYTVGQRKGLGLSMGHPVYVCGIIPDENKVVIGEESDLYSNEIYVTDYNFLKIPVPESGEEVMALVKIRYHHSGEWAIIRKISDKKLQLVFKHPVKSATPGQSAVFYDEEGIVVGGGIIC